MIMYDIIEFEQKNFFFLTSVYPFYKIMVWFIVYSYMNVPYIEPVIK